MDFGFLVPTLTFLAQQVWFGVASEHGTVSLCTDADASRKPRRAKVDLRDFDIGRKCADKFTNTSRNFVKLRILGFKNFGRKYVKIFVDSIAVSEKMTIFATQ